MTSYLLLRNNKESGPYSLNDLVSLGLKPYDLVWVKGKSAAWRYPGEIPELQEFAPPVEEQPFDRFYKKADQKVSASAVATADKQEDSEKEQGTRNKVQEVNEKYEVKKEAYVPKKSVFVTMPGQKQQQYQQQQVTKQEKVAAAAAISSSEYSKYQPVADADEFKPQTKTITITENPVTAEIKYSQPLDEIKEMYVKTLQQRKQRIANKAIIIQSAKKIAVILAIVGTGILIGFTLKSNKVKNEIAASGQINNSTVPANTPQQPAQTGITDPSAEQEPEIQQPKESNRDYIQPDDQPADLSTDKSTNVPVTKKETRTAEKQEYHEPENTNTVPEKNTTTTSEQVTKRKEAVINEPSPGVEINERTGERSKKTRNNDETANEQATTRQPATQPKAVMGGGNNLSKLVRVSSNNYQRVAFGGIRNLELTVTNDSKYLIDNVTVELHYLKPSEQPLRTETLQFRAISPGGSMTIRVPDTNRGIKVTYKITHILSTQSAKELPDL